MNVMRLLLMALALRAARCDGDAEPAESALHVAVPFGNPYKPQLDALHAELLEVYDVVRLCIEHFLMDVPLASGAEIEANCVGAHFSIVNHIFLLKAKKAGELYTQTLTERFEAAYATYPDEIAHFMALYKLFLGKGYHALYDTMQLAKRGARYYVREDVYDSLLALSKDMLHVIGDFSALLVREKNKIKEYIREQLLQRDANLKVLLRQDGGAVSEAEAHEAVEAESRAQTATLAQRIHAMDERVREETEKIKKGAAPAEEQAIGHESGKAGRFVPFEDSLAVVKDDAKAENALMQEFTPDAIKSPAREEETVKIDERRPVEPASEPILRDELDFAYERADAP